MSRRKRLLTAAFVAGFCAWIRFGALPQGVLDGTNEMSTIVLDRNGEPLYEKRSATGTRSARLSDEPPSALVDATIAAEDRRFYLHPGVDPLAIARAAVRNVRSGRVVEGASTITQQVAKLLLDRHAPAPRRRGLRGKIHEALVAVRLEHRLSKREILALYFDLAPYGNQVVGAARASEIYFGVSPPMLTVAQAAFLAGLPQRPSAYSPYRDRDAGRTRQLEIVGRMARQGRITTEQGHVARSEQLRFQPMPAAFVAPHFVEMVLSDGAARARGRMETTLDARLQAEVVGILRSQQADLEKHGVHNVAVVVLDNASSEWLAWEGSGNYFDRDHGGAINGALALRQPGSALKPFTYALGFEAGATPATVLPDVPATYPTAQPGVVYTPRNYDGTFHGPLLVRRALAGSQNVPAVAMASRVGVADVLRFLKSAGFSTFERNAAHYGLGLTLGNAEVSLAELTAAYAMLARGGIWMAPRALRDETTPSTRRVMSERAAYWITDVLSDADARAYVFGRGGSLEFPFAVAAKTGTSQAYRDNWTIGYTREVTVGVWAGNFDRRPLIGSSGITGAGPVFHAVMLAAQRYVKGRHDFSEAIVERPADLVSTRVCALSGMRAGDACPSRRSEWLPRDTSPLPCSWHHSSENGLLTFWPDEYRHWAADRGLLEDDSRTDTPVRVARTVVPRQRARFEIASPPAGAVYLLDPTLRSEFQAVSLRATGAIGNVEWRVNGRRVGRSGADHALSWPLRAGEHTVAARDDRGRAAEVTFRVK